MNTSFLKDTNIIPQYHCFGYFLFAVLESNFKKIKAVVEKNKANKDYIERISNKVNNKLEVLYSDEFHDRFWISNRKAGFLTGTSLNGIGKKYCNIQEIEKEDVIGIVNLLKNMQLIQ